MPILEIHTNMSAGIFPSDFHENLAAVAATVLTRPQRVVVVLLHTEQRLSMGCGDPDRPIFLLRVHYLEDSFRDADQNRSIIRTLRDYLVEEMALPANSVRILLVGIPACRVGLPSGELLADVLEERLKAESAEREARE